MNDHIIYIVLPYKSAWGSIELDLDVFVLLMYFLFIVPLMSKDKFTR